MTAHFCILESRKRYSDVLVYRIAQMSFEELTYLTEECQLEHTRREFLTKHFGKSKVHTELGAAIQEARRLTEMLFGGGKESFISILVTPEDRLFTEN